jgi:hypothetical protein
MAPRSSKKSASSRADKSQLQRFKDAARELGTDDDPKRFEERLGRLALMKPKATPKVRQKRKPARPDG